jgi:glyoxylase-like metal-dependent hydrolase (beta-lactamase superfamily II)/rhodanese-related sulfurtransferase
MYLTQLYTPGLAHLSYVIAGTKECIVIDPSRDVDRYFKVAEDYGMPITTVIETHLHADFVSGHVELAHRAGARIYMSKTANAAFPHVALSDGEQFEIDNLRFVMLDTPGHTPEGSMFIVSDLSRGDEPALMFSGDTLLVGDVGRPDLFPDIKRELAEKLYNSLRRLKQFGPHVEVYPAHGAGSLCGRALSAKLSTTLGTEQMYNYALKIDSLSEFIEALLQGMPEAPDHFSRCSEINRRGPVYTGELAPPRPLTPLEFHKAATEHVIVDCRDQLAFAGAHVPGSYSLSLRGNFATFSGWVLPPEKSALLVTETEEQIHEALVGLRRVGIDNVVGYLKGGMTAWANSGLEAAHLDSISIPKLREAAQGSDVAVIDTRLVSEWESGHIEGAVHIPAPDLRHHDVPSARKLMVICSTGNRSILAASLLKQRGYHNVVNVIGGMTAWQAAGYPQVK